jgi:hypothetical protein
MNNNPNNLRRLNLINNNNNYLNLSIFNLSLLILKSFSVRDNIITNNKINPAKKNK